MADERVRVFDAGTNQESQLAAGNVGDVLTQGAAGALNMAAPSAGAETDPVYSAWYAGPPNVSEFTNDAGYLTAESDPVFLAWIGGPPNISVFTNDVPYLVRGGITAHESWYAIAASATFYYNIGGGWSDGVKGTGGNPWFPRNIVAQVRAAPGQNCTGTLTIAGIDARGTVISEVFIVATGLGGTQNITGSKIFSSVTSCTVSGSAGISITFTIGTGDKMGLANPINAAGDVIALRVNGVYAAIPAIDTTYSSLDMTGLYAAGNLIECLYRPYK